MARCVRLLTENTAKMALPGTSAVYITREFSDLLRPQKQDERSGEEIVADILHRAGIEVMA